MIEDSIFLTEHRRHAQTTGRQQSCQELAVRGYIDGGVVVDLAFFYDDVFIS